MGRALVLNAHAKHSVVAIRCLGARGINVTAGSSRRWSAGRFSKHADRYVRYPDPDVDLEGFVCALEDELETGEYDMVLPINERTVETVVKHRSRFEDHATVPFPPYDQLRIGLNKRRTVEVAREFDIPHPETLFDDEVDLDTVEADLGYPVVAKSQRGSGRDGVTVCESREELERARRDLRERYGPLLFQEFVPNGGERGVYTLYGRPGELTGLTVQQRLRTYPPSGGASTYRETVTDPELVDVVDDLLTTLDWHGPAMVEFRIDARTGEPQLLEINPRLWGSLALSVYAGVDFPHQQYQMATDADLESNTEYEVDVQARCLFTDFFQVLSRDDTSRALAEFLTPAAKPCRYDIVSKRDPLPILGQVLYSTTALFEKGRKIASRFDDDSPEMGLVQKSEP